MSGTGRAIADDIEAEGKLRRKGHRTRWQAKVEGKDGRTLAVAKGKRRRFDDEDGLNDLRAAGFRVR